MDGAHTCVLSGDMLEWLGDWETDYLLLFYVKLTIACVIPRCLSLSATYSQAWTQALQVVSSIS